VQEVHPNKTHRNKTNEQPVDHLFDAFWNAYPRKLNKVGARKAWEARMADTLGSSDRADLASEVMRGLDNYLKTVAGREIEFVMHPSTFVGPAHRWRDYLDLGPKRVPAAAAGPVGKTAEQVKAEIAAARESIECEGQDRTLTRAAAENAAAFRRKAGLPAAGQNRGAS
jgi:hypothetical protein